MKLLEERIRKDGIVKPGNVLKVDSFLNHQMDIELFSEMGKEFKRLYIRGSSAHPADQGQRPVPGSCRDPAPD